MTILTGFLGSGKTTLLTRLLADPGTRDTAVLVNEFGEIAIDHHLVKEVREDLIVLGSGCVCCSVRNDLMRALCDLHVKAERGEIPRFARVIVETTGLADPTPIVGTVAKNGLIRSCFHLSAVVAAVDACLGMRTLAAQPESVKQVAVADRLVITKSELAREEDLENLERHLASLNPLAPRSRAERGAVPREAILARSPMHPVIAEGVASIDFPGEGHSGHGTHDGALGSVHGSDLHAFSETLLPPIDYSAFALWLSMMTQVHGEHLLRVKGILHVIDDDLPVVVQSVQHVVYPVRTLSAWPFAPPVTQIVVITRGLDPARVESLRESLRALVVLPARRIGRG